MMDWQAQRSVVGTRESTSLGRESFLSLSLTDSVFAFHGHKELNDNLWDGHEGVATREGVEKKNVEGIGFSRG